MPKKLNLEGQRFVHLVVLRESHIHAFPSGGQEMYWLCRCDCGMEKQIRTQSLRCGDAKTCGECSLSGALKAVGGRNKATHGHSRGGVRTKTHRVWQAMKTRCTNPNAWNYKYYGGRGIRVCDRWKDSFAAFLEDMGESPEGLSIDRIDANGNYEPGNCRWADDSTQRKNLSGPRKPREPK